MVRFDVAEAAAVLFCVVALLVVVFHLALIGGAPWGAYTLGGRWTGVLPARVRGISLLSILLLLLFSAVVLARSGLGLVTYMPYPECFVWCVVAYCLVGVVANAMSPSVRERCVWLPVVLCMLALSFLVAACSPSP